MVTRNDVKLRARHLLAVVLNMEKKENEIDDNFILSDDRLHPAMKKALSVNYTAISNELGGGVVKISEASGCKTVGHVIDLIWGKIPQGTT